MTDQTRENGTQFGREIAEHMIEEVRSIALKIEDAAVKQRRIEGMKTIVDRADRALQAAAHGRMIAGMTFDQSADWLREARAGFAARLAEQTAGDRLGAAG